jgi:acyl-CoA hydrolase
MSATDPRRTIKQRLGQTLEKELFAQKKISAEEIALLISRLARMSVNEVRNIARESRAIDCALARVFLGAIDDGDHHKLNFLLDRSIGKQPDVAQVNNTIIADTLPEQEQRAMLQSLMTKYQELINANDKRIATDRTISGGRGQTEVDRVVKGELDLLDA